MKPILDSTHMPATCRLGWGTIDFVGHDAKHLGGTKALLVTTASLARSPIVADVRQRLHDEGLAVLVDDHTTHVPDVARAEEGARLFIDGGCDVLVSVGGGNPHDLAKAIGLLATHERPIERYEGVDRLHRATPPHVAVNTTAGTGSEVSRHTFIRSRSAGRRVLVSDDRLTPRVAINDPATHLSMSPALTATSGMNVLAHAIEAHLSVDSSPLADALALDAIELVARHLPTAVADGSDREARFGMAEAEQLSAIAYSRAGLGLVDAISLTLSDAYNVPHGECSAIVLPYVLAYDAPTSEDRIAAIAEAMGAAPGPTAAADAVRDLARRVGLHRTLAELGVGWDVAYTFAWSMMESPLAEENPRSVTKDALGEILLDAVQGEEPAAARRRLATLPL